MNRKAVRNSRSEKNEDFFQRKQLFNTKLLLIKNDPSSEESENMKKEPYFLNVGMHLTQLFWKMAQYMGIATIMLSQYAVSGCVKCIPHLLLICIFLLQYYIFYCFSKENSVKYF